MFKNGLWFNVSEGSVSSINSIPTIVFCLGNHWRVGVGVQLPNNTFFSGWGHDIYWLEICHTY